MNKGALGELCILVSRTALHNDVCREVISRKLGWSAEEMEDLYLKLVRHGACVPAYHRRTKRELRRRQRLPETTYGVTVRVTAAVDAALIGREGHLLPAQVDDADRRRLLWMADAKGVGRVVRLEGDTELEVVKVKIQENT